MSKLSIILFTHANYIQVKMKKKILFFLSSQYLSIFIKFSFTFFYYNRLQSFYILERIWMIKLRANIIFFERYTFKKKKKNSRRFFKDIKVIRLYVHTYTYTCSINYNPSSSLVSYNMILLFSWYSYVHIIHTYKTNSFKEKRIILKKKIHSFKERSMISITL